MGFLDSLSPDEQYLFFRKIYSRHLVCLFASYVLLDDAGRDDGVERPLIVTGFVMDVDGHWFYITAGHVLRDINELVKSKKAIIKNFGFKDDMGLHAVSAHQTMLPDYEDIPKKWLDEESTAMDVAAMYIRPLYRAGLQANEIAPVEEYFWGDHSENFDHYCVCGVAVELTSPLSPSSSVFDNSRSSTFYPVLLNLSPTTAPEAETGKKLADWFFAKVQTPTDLKGIEGMSGAAIFGLRNMPDGDVNVCVVALQSRWLPNSRVAYGCRIKDFGPWVRSFKERLSAEGKLVE
ncbi:hypothetical protein [Zavarzinella formosa]|uniref:hypothetical protein n=1 Tax=Zavarzinella formosa TaxID=360055 RepID=UPI0012F8E2A7|nr:hypothetical protein [Zavarzinella formosa]